MADERIIRARLRFEADPQSAARAAQQTDKVRQSLKALEDQAARAQKRMQALKQDAERLGNVSRNLAFAGAALAAPLIAAAAQYANSAGQSERASRRWLAAFKDIEGAQNRIGRVAANALLPVLERAASVAEKLAAFAEQNPEAVKAALGIAGGLVTLGTLGTLAAQGIRMYADLKLLGASALMNTAADKMLAAAAANAGLGGVGVGRAAVGGGILGAAGTGLAALGGSALFLGGTAIAGGLGVGALAYDQMARARGGTNVGQYAATAAYGLGSLFGGEDLARQWFVAMSGLTDAVDANTQAQLEDAVSGQSGMVSGRTNAEWANMYGGQARNRSAARYALQQAGLRNQARTAGGEAFRSYETNLAELETQTADQRAAILAAFRERATQMETDYNDDRARLIADFEKSEARRLSDFQDSRARDARDFALREQQTEADYYAQRLIRARDFGQDMARFEEDYQREQRHAAEDHSDRLRDLAGGRDALGIVKEQREYERQRRRAEEEHQVEAARRNADFALALADQEAAFAEQREQRLAAYELRLKDEQEAFDKETQERNEDQAERLRDLDDQYRKEKSKLQAHLTQQQTQLEGQYLKEKNKLKAHLRDQFTQLSNGLGDVYDLFGEFIYQLEGRAGGGSEPWDPPPNPNGGDTPMATGGYATYGRYRMGERGREFVLNNLTTRHAEAALGGMLSQERILSGLSGGGGGGLNVHLEFHGSLTEGDRRWLTDWASQKAVKQVSEAVRRARTGRG